MKISTLAIIATLSLTSFSSFAKVAGLPATLSCDVSVNGSAEGMNKSITMNLIEGKNDTEERTILIKKDKVMNEIEVKINLNEDSIDIDVLAMDQEEEDILEVNSVHALSKGTFTVKAYVPNRLSDDEAVLLSSVVVDCEVE